MRVLSDLGGPDDLVRDQHLGVRTPAQPGEAKCRSLSLDPMQIQSEVGRNPMQSRGPAGPLGLAALCGTSSIPPSSSASAWLSLAQVTPTAPCSTSSLAICGVRMALQWGRQTWGRAMQVSSTASKGWRRGSKQNWAHPLPPAVEPRGGPRRAGAGGNFLCLMASLFLFK
jgi:hypothetical protein